MSEHTKTPWSWISACGKSNRFDLIRLSETEPDVVETIIAGHLTLEDAKFIVETVNTLPAQRDERLRGHTAWHPIIIPDRTDILAWREAPEGKCELLVYNNALCDPLYIAESTMDFVARASSPLPADPVRVALVEALKEARGEICVTHAPFCSTQKNGMNRCNCEWDRRNNLVAKCDAAIKLAEGGAR